MSREHIISVIFVLAILAGVSSAESMQQTRISRHPILTLKGEKVIERALKHGILQEILIKPVFQPRLRCPFVKLSCHQQSNTMRNNHGKASANYTRTKDDPNKSSKKRPS